MVTAYFEGLLGDSSLEISPLFGIKNDGDVEVPRISELTYSFPS